MRYYFKTSGNGRCGCRVDNPWKFTDKYQYKKDVKARYGGAKWSGKRIEVYTEEQLRERFKENAQAIIESAYDWN